jgi:hypothetical protein
MDGTDHMSHEFFSDYYMHTDPELVSFLQGKMSESVSMIIDDYIEAQKKGEIRQDINPRFIMYFMNQMMEMMKDENLDAMYATPQELIMEVTNFFFYGIMPRK